MKFKEVKNGITFNGELLDIENIGDFFESQDGGLCTGTEKDAVEFMFEIGDEKFVEKYALKLKKDGVVSFLFNDETLVVIEESFSEEGFIVDIYTANSFCKN